jgi:hypothetical protein
VTGDPGDRVPCFSGKRRKGEKEKENMNIRIGGREIPVALTVYEMIAIQEEIGCTVGEIREKVFGLERDIENDTYTMRLADDKELLKRFGKLIRIVGNAGLEEAGQEPDLTDKWVMRRIRPTELMDIVMDLINAIDDAMRTEHGTTKQDGPVDEQLEEENRKKEQES